MYRSKDFMGMNVEDVKGNKIGVVKDILINFTKSKIVGFSLSGYSVFKKDIKVLAQDIISYNDIMIVDKINSEQGVNFTDIRNVDVIDENNNIIGIVEDILFEEEMFNVRGVILSGGFIKNILKGKRIILVKDILVGEDNIMYVPNSKNITFFSTIHKIGSGR